MIRNIIINYIRVNLFNFTYIGKKLSGKVLDEGLVILFMYGIRL